MLVRSIGKLARIQAIGTGNTSMRAYSVPLRTETSIEGSAYTKGTAAEVADLDANPPEVAMSTFASRTQQITPCPQLIENDQDS